MTFCLEYLDIQVKPQFEQGELLFVPWSLIQNKINPLSIGDGIIFQQMIERTHHRLIIEPRWF